MRRKADQVNEVPLSVPQVQDVWKIYYGTPHIKRSRDALMAMTLHSPPRIEVENLDLEADVELTTVLETYWLPWLEGNYDYDKMIGITPWYFRRIRGTKHLYPCIPPWGSGYITTWLDKSHEQQFSWYWHDETKADKNMFFEYGRHCPALDGTLRSPMASLLADWKTERVVRQSTEIAAYQQVRRQHIIEHHPSKMHMADDNITMLESLGEEYASDVVMMQERLQMQKMTVRSDALREALDLATSQNMGVRRKFGKGPFMASESQNEQWERENASILSHSVTLKPDFVYKAVPEPELKINLEVYAKRLDQVSASVMDIPYQMTDTSGKLATNMKGVMRFVNERIRFWLSRFEMITKKAFVMAYSQEVENEFYKRRMHRKRGFFVDDEVTVSISVTPLAEYGELRQVLEDLIIDREKYAVHAFNSLGLPLEDIHIQPIPTVEKEAERTLAPPRKKKPKSDE